MEFDEKENLKLIRLLAWGTLREELGEPAFGKTKHFIWLEKGGYDLGVLLVHALPKNIFPVTADPDLAMEVQERFPDVSVICGDPVEVVKAEGRVFGTMCFGFHRELTNKFVDDITLMLLYGIKDGGSYFLMINPGHPEGDLLLAQGKEEMSIKLTRAASLSDRTVLEDYYSLATEHEKVKLRVLMAQPETFDDAVARARGRITKVAEELSSRVHDKKDRAQLRGFEFITSIRDKTWGRRIGSSPYEFVVLEVTGEGEFPVLPISKVHRGRVGESVEKFSRRMTYGTPGRKLNIGVYLDKEGALQEFYDKTLRDDPTRPKNFPWAWYFSVDEATVTELRKTWLKEPEQPSVISTKVGK